MRNGIPNGRTASLHRWCAGLLGLIAVGGAALLALKQIADVDVWFHLAYGRELLSERSFPSHEPFVYPLAENTAGLKTAEWFFALMLRVAEMVLGLPGVNLFVALFVGLTFLVLWRDRERPAKDAPFVPGLLIHAGVLLLAAVLMRERFQPRPEIVAYLFIAVVQGAIRRDLAGETQWLMWVPLLFVIWANTHPSTTVGLGLLGLHAAVSLAALVCARVRRGRLDRLALWHALVPAGATLAALLCSLVTVAPDAAFGVLSLVANLLLGGPANPAAGTNGPGFEHFVDELVKPGGNELWGLYGAFLSLVALSFILNLRRLCVSALLRAGAACVISLMAIRFIALAPLICAPLVSRNLTEFMLAQRQTSARATQWRGIAIAMLLIAAFPLAVKQANRFADERFGTGVVANRFPFASVDFLLEHGLHGPLYNPPGLGGFISWRGHPRLQVFQDARTPHGSVGPDALLAQFNESAFQRLAERYGFTQALVETITLPDDQALRMARRGHDDLGFPVNNWSLVFFDDSGSVYLERTGPYAALVFQRGYRCLRPANGLEYLSRQLTEAARSVPCLQEARAAVEDAPGATVPRLILARILLERGEVQEADEILRAARRRALGPLRQVVDAERGRIMWLKGDAQQACAFMHDAFANRLPNARAALLTGTACLAATPEDTARAARWFRRAIKLDPTLAGAYRGIMQCNDQETMRSGTAHYQQGFSKLAGRWSSDPDLRTAATLIAQQRYDETEQLIRRALARDADNVPAYSELGFALLRDGQPRQAIASFNRALAMDPFMDAAEYGLGLAYETIGNKRITRARLKRFLQLTPEGRWADNARAKLRAIDSAYQ